MEDTNRIRQQIDMTFPHRLSIVYEELVADWRGTTNKIQAYLGLDRIDLPLATYQQETRPLQQIVENYGEVVAYLRGQEWGE